MKTSSKRSIHVAGVIDVAEAQLLIDCGVRYLGFPLMLDHHREDLTINAAAAIISKLKDHSRFFLITYLNRASAIALYRLIWSSCTARQVSKKYNSCGKRLQT
jgi:phosphoribosylanthranilate isomerase